MRGSDGRHGSVVVWRLAFKDGERQLGRTLSKDERSAVHREISGQDYGYHDIVSEVLNMYGGGQ